MHSGLPQEDDDAASTAFSRENVVRRTHPLYTGWPSLHIPSSSTPLISSNSPASLKNSRSRPPAPKNPPPTQKGSSLSFLATPNPHNQSQVPECATTPTPSSLAAANQKSTMVSMYLTLSTAMIAHSPPTVACTTAISSTAPTSLLTVWVTQCIIAQNAVAPVSWRTTATR